MNWESRNFVLFKTDLFVFRQPDADIDRWAVGGDCAGWLYARLLPAGGVRPDCEPVMEDWGWTCAVAVAGLRVWVNVWAFHPVEDCWLLGVEVERGLFRRPSAEAVRRGKSVVCGALDGVLAGDPRVRKRDWFADNPFDLNVKDF